MTKPKVFKILSITAYDNSWKVDDNGAVVLQDGNPVYVDSSGKEMVVRHDTISRLNGEAKSHREAKEALEAKFKDFEGLDAKAAREALEKLKQVDQKKLIDAGEVEKVRSQIQSEYGKQLEEKDAALKTLQSTLDSMQINSVFGNSEFVRESLAVPRDMFEATFRSNFKVEEGKVVAYDKSGNRLMSKKNVGEYASPDEALMLLVEAHPQKDVILKADIGSGSGSSGAGGTRGSVRSISRSDFEKLTPLKQSEVVNKIRAGEMKLTD